MRGLGAPGQVQGEVAGVQPFDIAAGPPPGVAAQIAAGAEPEVIIPRGNTVIDLRAWLFTLMHNLYLNQRRSAARGQWLDIDSLSETLAAPEDSSDAALDLERCLRRLPAEQRAVLLLVSVEDMSYADTARVLQLPLGTVMSRLSRARSRLRELMEAPSATSAPPAPTAGAATPQAAAPALRRLK